MSAFFSTNRKLAFKRVTASNILEIDSPTTISFYIKEIFQDATITSIDYKVEKQNGRTYTELTAWTALDITGMLYDVYTIDYTLTGTFSSSDNIVFSFKVVDEDGIEHFHSVNDFKTIS